MNVPFPYDVIGFWMKKHKIELSQEAYNELATYFDRQDEIHREEIDKLKEEYGI